tara:strand:- start:764 stop:1354 length:591 start_codon:yes stop_codon:yes gene_type:complete
MIVKELDELRTICEPVSSIDEGKEIADKLLDELKKSDTGIGIAANQIGINKRVCVINVIDTVILINPKVISTEESIQTVEACLSFPGKQVYTNRFKHVTVECDNLGKVMFGPTNHMDEKSEKSQLQLLESVCVQHEIDHLDGITMFDRSYKRIPITRNTKKYGRNEKVEITNGTETKILKWKKAEVLVNEGSWQIN